MTVLVLAGQYPGRAAAAIAAPPAPGPNFHFAASGRQMSVSHSEGGNTRQSLR